MGTGLTIIVGENGCGKTTILDSIAISMLDYRAESFNIYDFNEFNKEVNIVFYSNKEFTDEQKEMIDSILEYSGLVKSVNKGKEFIAWNSTLNGDKRCNQLYEAAEKLGYIKR